MEPIHSRAVEILNEAERFGSSAITSDRANGSSVAPASRKRAPRIQEMHITIGHTICELVEQQTRGQFKLRPGTLYPLLSSLELEGLLRAEWSSDEDIPKRKYFHITEKGKKVLRQETDSLRVLFSLLEKATSANWGKTNDSIAASQIDRFLAGLLTEIEVPFSATRKNLPRPLVDLKKVLCADYSETVRLLNADVLKKLSSAIEVLKISALDGLALGRQPWEIPEFLSCLKRLFDRDVELRAVGFHLVLHPEALLGER